MDALTVIVKGIILANNLLDAGKDVAPILKDLVDTFNGKEPTEEELEALEQRLDAQLEEFNSPLPD